MIIITISGLLMNHNKKPSDYISIKLHRDFVEKNIDPFIKKEDGVDSRAGYVKGAVKAFNEKNEVKKTLKN